LLQVFPLANLTCWSLVVGWRPIWFYARRETSSRNIFSKHILDTFRGCGSCSLLFIITDYTLNAGLVSFVLRCFVGPEEIENAAQRAKRTRRSINTGYRMDKMHSIRQLCSQLLVLIGLDCSYKFAFSAPPPRLRRMIGDWAGFCKLPLPEASTSIFSFIP
jgi:hypothetical protein